MDMFILYGGLIHFFVVSVYSDLLPSLTKPT